jgi:hypothetical protein
MLVHLLGVARAGVVRVAQLGEGLRHRQQHLVHEAARLPRRYDMLLELLQQRALRFGLAVDHANVAEQVAELVAAEVFFFVLPLLRIGVAQRGLDAADDLGLEDVSCAQVQATAVEYAEDAVGRIQVRRRHRHQVATGDDELHQPHQFRLL